MLPHLEKKLLSWLFVVKLFLVIIITRKEAVAISLEQKNLTVATYFVIFHLHQRQENHNIISYYQSVGLLSTLYYLMQNPLAKIPNLINMTTGLMEVETLNLLANQMHFT